MNLRIRKAKKSDAKEILKLIIELAKFEKLTPPGKAEQRRLISDAFSKNPPFKIILAFDGKEAIGYAFYFFTYSTFLAKPTLYLEDIYISDKCRGYGVGKKLMNELISIAKKKKCGRLEWIVLDWNKNAIDFYDRLGAKGMNEWKFYRYTL
jgi:ribosomal protein S18 acetylase RimI-like enzyme